MEYIGYVSAAAALLAVAAAMWSTITAFRIHRQTISMQATLKISDFRQVWINDLRNAMAEFQSYGVTPELSQERERKFYELGTRIELLMNPADEKYQALQTSLYRFLNANTPADKFSANPEFIAICQKILKTEWEILKRDIKKPLTNEKHSRSSTKIWP